MTTELWLTIIFNVIGSGLVIGGAFWAFNNQIRDKFETQEKDFSEKINALKDSINASTRESFATAFKRMDENKAMSYVDFVLKEVHENESRNLKERTEEKLRYLEEKTNDKIISLMKVWEAQMQGMTNEIKRCLQELDNHRKNNNQQ